MKKILIIVLFFTIFYSCKNEKSDVNESDNIENISQQTLYFGGDIITMVGETPQYVEAVIERDGKIIYTGDKVSALTDFEGKTIGVDLKGKTMMPGLIDAHSHFMSALQMVDQVNLSAPPVGDVKNIPNIIERLKAFQKERNIQKEDWIIGWGYDETLLEEQRHITKNDLDKHFLDYKVLLIHTSMHGAVLNSKALDWAKIDENTPTPDGGIIARLDGGNEPAGLLMEMAYIPVFSSLPEPTENEMLDLMYNAQMSYASEGYTHAVEGFTHVKHIDFLMKAASENKLVIDIVGLPAFTEIDDWIDNPKYKFGNYDNRFKLQGGKITLDGSNQGKTGFFTTPYLTGGPNGEENWTGEASIPKEALFSIVKRMVDKEIQPIIHCNADAAIDWGIEAIENAGITAKDNKRPVIIHSQFQRPDHLPKYVELGITPSYFANHTYFWGDVHLINRGEKETFFTSPIKSAKEAGIITSNHSDFGVTPLDPWFMIWASMVRESRSGKIIGPDERIDAYTALQTLTTGPAYQMFEENRKGSIKEGLLADFIIIDKNPLKIEPSEIKSIEVLETIKEGKTVYKKN